MTKIYIIAEHFPYEGYSVPLGAYSSKRKAEKALIGHRNLSEPDIYELIIDEPLESYN